MRRSDLALIPPVLHRRRQRRTAHVQARRTSSNQGSPVKIEEPAFCLAERSSVWVRKVVRMR
jgi:hypothetical protein